MTLYITENYPVYHQETLLGGSAGFPLRGSGKTGGIGILNKVFLP